MNQSDTFVYKAEWPAERNSVVVDQTDPRQGGTRITDEKYGVKW